MKTLHSTARTFMALVMGTLVLAFASCKKSPETIGNNLISGDDFIDIFHTDTAAIVCHSYWDSVNTTNANYALLGSMKDPVCGTSEAGFFTQFRMSLAGQSFGTAPVLDSLVLQLSVGGYYGDTMVCQTVHVYELTDTLSSQANYYNNDIIDMDPIDMANGYQFYLHPKQVKHVIGTDTINHAIIRIPLSNSLGEKLMHLDSVAYLQPDYFKAAFKGLYVKSAPVSQTGVIASINLTDNVNSLLQLYYHNATMPEKAMRYDYYVTSSDAYFNHIDHDYTQGSPEFVDQLINAQTAKGQEKLYLQCMGGIRARVRFPNLEHWGDSLEGGHVVINEAKLVLPVTEGSVDSVFKLPSTLVLLGINTDSTTYLLPDYYEGTGYFGGTYNSKDGTVTFRISEYLQSIMLGRKDNVGLSLGINGAAYNAHRMLINGPDAPIGKKMKLEVTYSIVNE